MYNKNNHFHFIGIGGIGMSAIATILKQQGYRISGCDSNLNQKSVHNLTALGCSVYQDDTTPRSLDDAITAVVYSSSIADNHLELVYARAHNIPVIHRSHMLAELMRVKESIAITGAHGKTTTTSLVSHVLLEAKTDPTLVIGGHLNSIASNGRWGSGPFLVAEADESDRSFLHLPYSIAIITNIDLEHLDVYKDLDDIKQTFIEFIQKVPFYGKVIMCNDDEHSAAVIAQLPSELKNKIITYGFSEEAMVRLTNSVLEPTHSSTTIVYNNQNLGTFTVALAGIHNLLNAAASLAACLELGISFATTAQALSNFTGVDRRFTFRGFYKNAEIFDDYGHHPAEIAHVLTVAKKRAKNKLIVVFQPHRFTRVQALWQDFLHTLSPNSYDQLIITDIYTAGEKTLEGVSSENLTKELVLKTPEQAHKISYIPTDPDFLSLRQKLACMVEPEDLIVFLGAGNITSLAKNLS